MNRELERTATEERDESANLCAFNAAETVEVGSSGASICHPGCATSSPSLLPMSTHCCVPKREYDSSRVLVVAPPPPLVPVQPHARAKPALLELTDIPQGKEAARIIAAQMTLSPVKEESAEISRMSGASTPSVNCEDSFHCAREGEASRRASTTELMDHSSELFYEDSVCAY